MAISELVSTVSPPKHPIEAGPADRWPTIQQQIGINLPSDCRDFGLSFGTGKFVELGLLVFNPFSASFSYWLEESLAVWRSLKKGEGNDEVPFGVFPEVPGLLPWGSDEDGNGLFWFTEGNPEEWPVVVRGDNPKYDRFEMEMTTFLARVMAKKIVLPHIWPKRVFRRRAGITFVPLEVRPKPRQNLRSIYQLYMENGMRAGFWVEHEIWDGTNDQIRVKSVNGQTEGPLNGYPPNYGNGPVLIDVYTNGSLAEENVELPIASDQGFRIAEKPMWWKD